MTLESNKKLLSNEINKAFINSCFNGDLPTVKYMLTSKQMTCDSKISLKDNQELLDEGMLEAAFSLKNDIVKYLLSSSELDKHANVHAMNDRIFRTTTNNNIELLNYIIFELNVYKNKTILECLTSDKYSLANQLFKQRDIRDLNNELNDVLPTNKDSTRKKLKA